MNSICEYWMTRRWIGRWIRCINEKRKVKESNSRAFTRPGFQDQLPTNGCYLPYAEN